jgi:hypothetical protein
VQDRVGVEAVEDGDGDEPGGHQLEVGQEAGDEGAIEAREQLVHPVVHRAEGDGKEE